MKFHFNKKKKISFIKCISKYFNHRHQHSALLINFSINFPSITYIKVKINIYSHQKTFCNLSQFAYLLRLGTEIIATYFVSLKWIAHQTTMALTKKMVLVVASIKCIDSFGLNQLLSNFFFFFIIENHTLAIKINIHIEMSVYFR